MTLQWWLWRSKRFSASFTQTVGYSLKWAKGMCGPKEYDFSVINYNRVWLLHSSLESGMFFLFQLYGHFASWLDLSKLLQISSIQRAYRSFLVVSSATKPNSVACVKRFNFWFERNDLERSHSAWSEAWSLSLLKEASVSSLSIGPNSKRLFVNYV